MGAVDSDFTRKMTVLIPLHKNKGILGVIRRRKQG